MPGCLGPLSPKHTRFLFTSAYPHTAKPAHDVCLSPLVRSCAQSHRFINNCNTVDRSKPKQPPGAKELTPAEKQAAVAAARKQADHNPEPWKNNGVWENKIVSFVVNGEAWHSRERMYGLLHHYHSGSAHTKSHMMGNSLADRILVDDRVAEKLSESTWTTTALHHGLQYGTQGPLTHPRQALIHA